MAKADTFHKPNKKLLKAIGERIRLLRKQANFTIEELSDRSKINPKYLQRCETAKVNISISVLHHIIKGLDISLKQFFEDFQ